MSDTTPEQIPTGAGTAPIANDETSEAVNERIDKLLQFAENAKKSAETHLRDLASETEDMKPPEVDLDFDMSELPEIPSVDLGDVPEAPKIDDNFPDEKPDKPEMDPISSVGSVTWPSFEASTPDIEYPDKPDIEYPDDPGDPPDTSDVETPDAPDLDLPDPPTLDDIEIPDAPDVDIPEFGEVLTPWDVEDPEEFSWGEPSYSSDLWSDLLSRVLDDIKNGGTGLPEEVEEAIYKRHLNRVQEENDKMYQKAENYFSARGFTMPPGMLAARLNEVDKQIARNNQDASRDIMANQAELAHKHSQFIMDLGVRLEGTLRDFFIKEANLSLEASRSAADNAIAIYNAKVEKFRYLLEEYRVKSQVWEAQVRAALQELEAYRAKVEGARVSAQTQEILVNIYRSKLQAATTHIELYRAQMEGANIKSQIEQNKILAFKERVNAYVAQVEGQAHKVNLYDAELRGEATKASIYQTQVEAYGTEVSAKAKELDGKIAEHRAELETNRNKIEQYQAEIQAYAAEIDAEARRIDAKIRGFEGEVSGFQAEAQAKTTEIEAKRTEQQGKIEAANLGLQGSIAKLDNHIKAFTAAQGLQMEGAKGVSNVSAQLAASAMNAVTANIGLSYGSQDTSSRSSSNSWQGQLSYQQIKNIEE